MHWQGSMTGKPSIPIQLILCVALFFRLASASPSASELLRQSMSYFDRGQYHKALEQLASLNIQSDFDNSDDMKQAFKIRAISYEQTGDKIKAIETIRELFFLDPNYQFNPFDTPKSVVALAQQEKLAFEEKNQYLASIKNDARHDVTDSGQKSETLKAERTVLIEKRPHLATTLFPLGLNHFFLESPMKGGVYLSLQALSLATNVAAFWWKQSYLRSFGSTRLKDQTYKSSFETAQMIQYIGLGALLLSYGISVIDALIRFQSMPSQKLNLDEITS